MCELHTTVECLQNYRTLKWTVVEKWLLGYPRVIIATECQVGTGTVSSIVAEWKHAVGLDLANLIRDIGVTLKKLGMSPAQCATGLRVANLIDRIGLDEDSIETFLSDVYTKLQEAGVNPKHIARYVEGLTSLLEGRNNKNSPQTAISLPEMDRIFEKMKQDKIRLEEEFKMWETQVTGDSTRCIPYRERYRGISRREEKVRD